MFEQCAGSWVGANRLYFEGADGPMLESPSHLTVAIVIGGFLQLSYDWIYEGNPKQGLILIGDDSGKATAAWVDSFHASKQVMGCVGAAEANVVNVKGSYTVAEGPDWGWRIHLELRGAELRLTMFNISPDGQEFLAVLAVHHRV